MFDALRKIRQDLGRIAAERPHLAAINLAVLIFAVISGFRGRGGETAEFLCVALLAMLVNFDTLRQTPQPGGATRSSGSAAAGWLLLGAGAAVLTLTPGAEPLPRRMAAMLFFAPAAAFHWSDRRSALRQLPFYLLALFILPFFSRISLYVSYPLRRLSAMLSAELLRFFRHNIDYEQTVIRLDGAEVAITDACSGIQQLAAMALIAYLLIRRERLTRFWKFQYCLFLIPAVTLANALRIIVTVLLYHRLGEKAFSDPVHLALGWLQVPAAMLILFGAGKLLPRPVPEAESC